MWVGKYFYFVKSFYIHGEDGETRWSTWDIPLEIPKICLKTLGLGGKKLDGVG